MKSYILSGKFFRSASGILAASALFSASPDAHAVIVTIVNNGPRTVQSLVSESWAHDLASVNFQGTLPASGNPEDITAVLIFPSSEGVFNAAGGTQQRVSIVAGAAGAFQLESGANLVISGNQNAALDNGYGGALYVGNQGAFALKAADPASSSLTFSQNSAKAGGAVYLANATDILPFGAAVAFEGNHSTNGSGGALYANATLDIRNAGAFSFSQNTAQSSGGAIYANRSLTLGNGVRFSQNSAQSSGGAIFADDALAVKNDVQFLNNTADVNGGAVYAGTATFGNNALFTGNRAITGDGFGGAVFVNSGATFGANARFGGTTDAEGNQGKRGGAIYLGNGDTLAFGANAQFLHNKSTGEGGGAIYAKASLTIANAGAIAFIGNQANPEGASGGAIFVNDNFTIGANATFTENSALTGGAVILLNGNASFGDNVSFTQNTAVLNGGAVYATGNIALGANAIATGNQANNGGAIWLSGGTLALGTNAAFTANTALSSGGAVYSSTALIVANTGPVTFTANTASGTSLGGGAIYSAGNLTLGDSVTFGGDTPALGNHAANGGALYLGGTALTLGNTTTFRNNTASASGGALFASGALTVTHSGAVSFTENSAIDGGALYSGAALTLGNAVSFTRNTATVNGGAVRSSGNLTLGGNALFSANTAANGGALWLSGGTLALGDTATFRDNIASGTGGAVSATTALVLTHTGPLVFSGNKAATGGALATPGILTLSGNTLFRNNTATLSGGAISAAALNFTAAATNGDIYFTGNKVGTTPNAAILTGGASTFTGDRAIVFDDPLTASSGITTANSLTSSAAIVQFAGASILNPVSLPAGKIEFTAGRLLLLPGAILSTGGAAISTNGVTLTTATSLTGAGTLTAPGGIRISGTVAPDSIRYIPNADLSKPGSFSGFEIGTLTLDGNSDLSGATVNLQVGSTPDTTDKLIVNGTLNFDDHSNININGNTDSGFDSFPFGITDTPIIETTGGINGFGDAHVSIAGDFNAEDYLRTGINLDPDGKRILLKTTLAWYSTNTAITPVDLRAHGTFTLVLGKTFTVNIALNDHTTNLSDAWLAASSNGRILTKRGSGTLVLARSGDYSGGSFIEEGTLRLAAENAAGTGTLALSGGSALELAFTGTLANKITGHGGTRGDIRVLADADITIHAASTGTSVTGANFTTAATAAVRGTGTYDLASVVNYGDFHASVITTSASITNHATFAATTVNGSVINGAGNDHAAADDPVTPRFTVAGTATGAILNRGIFAAKHVNTPTGFDFSTPLVINPGTFDAEDVTGSINNSGTFRVGAVNTPGTGLPEDLPLVLNTGTFEATTVNGSVTNGTAPAEAPVTAPAFRADIVTGTVINHGFFRATEVKAPANVPADAPALVVNTGDFDARTVTGAIVNSGTLVADIVNTPAAGITSSRPLVTNSGILTANTINGALLNTGTASLGSVGGVVVNSGTIYLRASATWGALNNSAGTIRFEHNGHTLTVDSLAAGYGTNRGLVYMDVDLADPANTDLLVVNGNITGEHHFVLTNSDPSEDYDKMSVVRAPKNTNLGDEQVTGEMITPLREYSFIEDSNGGYMLAKTSKYGPGATVIANTVGSMSIAWFSQLDNIEKRLGDLRLNAEMIFPVRTAPTTETDDIYADPVPAKKERINAIPGSRPPHPAGVWARAYGQHVNADLRITGMRGFSEDQYGLDVGVDREFIYSRRDVLYAGGFAGYQGARRDFRDGYGSKGDTDSFVFGLYGAWLRADGFFLEADAKGQRYASQYDALGDHGDYDTWGAGVSFRFGYHLRFAETFFLEPSLAFSYVHIFGENFSTDNGLYVTMRDSDIRAATASVRLGKAIEMGSHGVFQPYVKAGIEGQSNDAGSVRIGILELTPDTNGTRGIMGVGGAWQLNVRQQIYFDYEYVWGDKYEKPWSVSLGYRHLF